VRTKAERLLQITSKIEWAKAHIDNLNREVGAFRETQPYRIDTKRNPQTGQLIYYMSKVDAVPQRLALIAGDVIHNLASALDFLAYQIVCSSTNDAPRNPRGIYFPTFASAEKYEALKRGKMEGAGQEVFEALDALKPYKGGNDLLWALHELNNIDKHRLLITAGGAWHRMNIAATLERMLPAEFLGKVSVPAVIVRPKSIKFPMEEGDVLFIDAADAEPDEKLQFEVSVSLYEPQIIEPQPIVTAVHQFATLVEGVVEALSGFLRGRSD
jgi:hypothetical protein